MTMNSSGIRDIQRVLGISIVSVLAILRRWFKSLSEPVASGHYKKVQVDEMWTFVKYRKTEKASCGTFSPLKLVRFGHFTLENATIRLVKTNEFT